MTSGPRVLVAFAGELKPEGDPVDRGELSAKTKPVEHRVFAGTLDRHQIGFGERPMGSSRARFRRRLP